MFSASWNDGKINGISYDSHVIWTINCIWEWFQQFSDNKIHCNNNRETTQTSSSLVRKEETRVRDVSNKHFVVVFNNTTQWWQRLFIRQTGLFVTVAESLVSVWLIHYLIKPQRYDSELPCHVRVSVSGFSNAWFKAALQPLITPPIVSAVRLLSHCGRLFLSRY